MKPTIAKKIGLPLLMLAFSGVVALWQFSRYIQSANSDAASQNRLLSEQLRVFVDLARRGDSQDRLRVLERVEGFEQFLAVLERGGHILGRKIDPATQDVMPDIRRVRKHWEETKPALLSAASPNVQDPARSYQELLGRLEGLAAASLQLVDSYESRRRSLQQQTVLTLAGLSVLDVALMFVGLAIVIQDVVRPVQRIEAAARRVQAGDFAQRLPVVTHDELATLARSFNQMSAHVAQLLALIEAERRSALASEQRLREMIQDLDAIVWEADPDTLRFSFVSQRAESILGYPANQWIEDPEFWVNHLYPDDRDWAVEFCRRAARQGQFEYRMVAADGRVVWIRDQVRLSAFGSLRRLRGLMMDISRARAADLALQRSEATNRALLNAIPDLMMRVRRDGTYFDLKSARAIALFSDPQSLIGKTIAETLPPDVAQEAIERLEMAFSTGDTQIHEFTMAVDGELHDYEARVVACGPDDAVIMIREITERKRAEEALRAAEAELRRVIASVSDCLWSAEADDQGRVRYLYYSPVAEKISGRPAAFYRTPDDWFRTVQPADRPRLEEALRRIVAGGSDRAQEEYRVVWPDGSVRWVRSTIMRRQHSDRVRLDGVESDITSDKLSEEALRQAKETLEAIIDASPLPIYAMDLHGSVTRWNAAAERVFGWREEEVLGRRLPFIPEDELEEFYSRVERGRRGATLTGWEVTRRRRDGTPVDLSVWTAILRDASGAPSGFIGIAIDMTDRKLLEEQLRQSQKMEAVGRLAGGVAHDFNNLLTVITGYGYMLLDDLAAGNVLRTNVEEILRAVERASALTNQLLAFSRRQIAQPRPLDLKSLVVNMDKMLRRVIGEDIELVAQLGEDVGQVKADPGQIEQVIMNLVVNSRDALPGGGRIIIETANVELDRAFARLHLTARPGSYVMLAVADNGTGMDAETKAHLFEPFYTTKELGKGTGLGLSTVYGIIKQSGGEIDVQSAQGEGTRVAIYLPRSDEAVPEPKLLQGEYSSTRGSETVLVVEDEVEVRRLVCDVLQQHGYTILEASEPEEALDICSRHPGLIHLLLTDVVMPRMNGRELAERVAWVRSDTRVLFMSGYTDDVPHREGFGAADVFLKKPFTPAALACKIREVLDR